jgi:hypothetical protein
MFLLIAGNVEKCERFESGSEAVPKFPRSLGDGADKSGVSGEANNYLVSFSKVVGPEN